MIETAGCAEDCLGFDALNYAEAVVWVNDLVTDLKCHTSPKRSCKRKENRGISSSLSIPEDRVPGNENRPKIGLFCTFLPRAGRNPGGAWGACPLRRAVLKAHQGTGCDICVSRHIAPEPTRQFPRPVANRCGRSSGPPSRTLPSKPARGSDWLRYRRPGRGAGPHGGNGRSPAIPGPGGRRRPPAPAG